MVSILKAGFSEAKILKLRDSDPDALWLWAEVELDSNQRNTYIEWVTAKIAGEYVRASGFEASTLREKTDRELYFFKAPDTVIEGDHPIKVTAYSNQEFISDEYVATVRTGFDPT